MRSSLTVATMVARVAWVLQIALGIVFWTGKGTGLVPLHILIGLVFVVALWVLAVLGLRARVGVAIALVTIVWGVVVLLFGLGQAGILLGSAHWVIQVLHLLIGIAAIALAETISRGLRRA